MGCASSSPADTLTETERLMGGRKGIDKSERIHSASERVKSAARRAKAVQRANSQDPAQPPPPASPPKLNASGQLVAEEVAKRISGSVETKDVVLGNLRSDDADPIRVRYAALTQRGYYPDNPHKENQDAYQIVPSSFASGDGDAFFGVYDGHGDAGHACAQFAREKLHLYLGQGIKKQRAQENAKLLRRLAEEGVREKPKNAFHPSSWPHLDVEGYEKCCRMAHLMCNKAMHDDKKVKDSMSGTTSISIGFHAGRMTVSNVGDSRVVLGYRVSEDNDNNTAEMGASPTEEEKKEIGEESDEDNNINGNGQSAPPESGFKESSSPKTGKLVAIPLSEDQTPYRKDERERLKKAGARICSIDQMEGKEPMHENWGEMDLGIDIDEHGDPPRVWCRDHDYPGTAFSRSLGDTVGEDLGVNAEPEILTKEVTRGDEIVVIASDGIFEFLTNQRVIDICAECDDPQHACTRLLEESYKQWLHYELRTDDITCIVLFLKNGREDDEEVVRSLMNKKCNIKKVNTQKMGRELSIPQMVGHVKDEQ